MSRDAFDRLRFEAALRRHKREYESDAGTERDRIRTELITWLAAPNTVVPIVTETGESWAVVDAGRLREAIDRICPP